MEKKKYLWEILMTLFLVLLVAILGSQYQSAQKQNASWQSDYRSYSQAYNDLSSGQAEEALPILQKLLADPRYTDSASMNWSMGNTYAVLGYLEPAEEYYLKARTIHPAYVLDTPYQKNMAILKYKQKDYVTAQKYLMKISENSTDPTLKKWADDVLKLPEFQQGKE